MYNWENTNIRICMDWKCFQEYETQLLFKYFLRAFTPQSLTAFWLVYITLSCPDLKTDIQTFLEIKPTEFAKLYYARLVLWPFGWYVL